MPPDPHVPDAFDVHTVVVLRRPTDAPEMSDEELDELQTRHLAYRAELAHSGAVIVNGPFDQQSDSSHRGMSIFSCDPVEPRGCRTADPSVIAGRLAYDVMQWWVRAGSLAFPLSDQNAGEPRSLPGE